jgi:mannose-6-phosphate isomerase-like protein (cupin superfamily)
MELQSSFVTVAKHYRTRTIAMKALNPSTGVLDHQPNDRWLQITPGERFRIRTSVKETNGIYTMLELAADRRNGVPMHIHQNEDEHFIILEGMLHVANGKQRFDAPAGTTVTVNKGVAHAWCNLQDTPLRMLVVFSPGDIEGLFKATAARETDDIAALAAKYGTLLVDPALLEEIHTITSPRT